HKSLRLIISTVLSNLLSRSTSNSFFSVNEDHVEYIPRPSFYTVFSHPLKLFVSCTLSTYFVLATHLCRLSPARNSATPYYGKLIGSLQEYAHKIKGTAYAVDESTIFIKGFNYDGTGPDAFFWVGNTARPSPEGHIIPYPEGYKG
ncbi:hypothetical protein L9F63_018018, partial [Diploptera punctata]